LGVILTRAIKSLTEYTEKNNKNSVISDGSAYPACLVAPTDGTGVASGNGTGGREKKTCHKFHSISVNYFLVLMKDVYQSIRR